jgi:hypothetical protein
VHKVEGTHIPGMKDNHKVSNPVFVEGSLQMADSLASEVDSSALEVNSFSVPGVDTLDRADRVDTPDEIEAPPMGVKTMSQIHALGRKFADQRLYSGEFLLLLPGWQRRWQDD